MTRVRDMTRRDLLRVAGLGAAAIASGAQSAFAQIAVLRTSCSSWRTIWAMPTCRCYGRPDLKTPNIDRIAATGVRFLQAYANSAVCSATRTALITGRYQYRLRARARRAARAGNPVVGLPPDIRPCRRCCKQAGYGTTLIGKWHLGELPTSVRSRAATTTSTGSAAARIDYYSHTGTDRQDDLWDDDVPIASVGYMTDLLGDRAVDVVERLRDSAAAVLRQPALQRAALAVGGARRRGRVRAAAETRDLRDLRRRYRRRPTSEMIEAMDAQIGRVLQALDDDRPDRATPSSSSPATTAASASRIPGRSPAGRRNCSKAGCAFPRSSRGRRGFRRARRASR